MAPTKLHCLDLFSGIGGFAYALRSVAKTVAYCEISDDCRSVLSSNMAKKLIDKAPIFEDVTTFDPNKELPTSKSRYIELITAGFPCQDISIANPEGKGIHGERSGLVKHVFRLMDCLPSVRAVLLENSPNIRSRGIEVVLGMFAKRDFECTWDVFNSVDVGAPMQRKRWYCLAVRKGGASHLRIARQIAHDWKAEPVDRLVPRDQGALDHQNLHRCMMLGNSVVPQCVVHAFNILVMGALSNSNDDHYKGRPKPHPGIELVLKQGATVYRRKYWASPCHSCWPQYNKLTLRSTRNLSNQIYYEESTEKKFNYKNKRVKLIMRYRINPQWTEWLMGYPPDFTHNQCA